MWRNLEFPIGRLYFTFNGATHYFVENYQWENLRLEVVCGKRNYFYDVLLNSEHVRRDVDTLRLRRSSVTWRRTRWRRYMNQPPPPPTTKQPPNISRQAGTIHPDHSGKKNCFFFFLSFFSLKKFIMTGRAHPWGTVVLPHLTLAPQKNRLPHPIDKVFSQWDPGHFRDASPSKNSFCFLQQNWICLLELSTMKQNKKNAQILNYTPFFV